jgi:hypothetical protein
VVVHYATSRKLAGSILYEATGLFKWLKLFSHNTALGSTQPLKETSAKNLPGGEEG